MGTSEVYLLDMVSAYGVYPNRGIHVSPIGITRIYGKSGEVLEEQVQGKERVALSAETAGGDGEHDAVGDGRTQGNGARS